MHHTAFPRNKPSNATVMTVCPPSLLDRATYHSTQQQADGDQNTMQSEYQQCLIVERQQSPVNEIRLAATYATQNGMACPKTYGTTNISGPASVIQGDVYIPNGVLKVECRHSQTHWRRQTLPCPARDIETFGSITRITTRHHDGWRILPWVTSTQKTVTTANSSFTERSWTVSVNILQCIMLTFGLACQPSGLTLFRPNLRNIVPDDAPFIVACKRGDLITMRSLVAQGQASYSDITKDNLTPLYFVLESGIVAAVQEVLNHNTNIDATFGSNQTSALAWALYHRNLDAVRLILARDADLHHISLLGWTPVFYLWKHQTELQSSSLELLQMLQTSDPRGFKHSISGIIDIGHMSLLHRVASLGTPDELQWLLDSGADPHLRTGKLEWTAMFDAAYDGRLDNLYVLEEDSPGSAIQDRDLRGWSLLHVAAVEGQKDTVKWLLNKGADPFAKSQASFVDVPEALFGLECTPSEVARAESVEKEQDYWDAVMEIYGTDFLSREGQ